MPWTYRHSTREFRAFLDDVKDRMDLASDNMAYTAVDAVFQVFRKRLTAQQGLDFASVLPSIPRAIFVKDWQVSDPPEAFADRAAMTREAQLVRVNHNLTPENAIEATAWALRRSLDQRAFDRVLARIGKEAESFWHVNVTDPTELAQRIV
ncbi:MULTISPECIES: DUF2267 domain-containing protein [unclassified Paracoccus (in: a-proteobacteria)]|uniref:DUF2267 domain-containing protein n=1 Tax=unclassified Paracoccus (in: a-proteobacteria) TaxID=2688777 RepID=UPI001E3C5660|nr:MULTISPECIES: DUF2267 domain-containing protein [unclassified Paracoccus (in: a-proteobacteria)]UXU74476.1 DUF2267 domain-containing protein [Paracoccus sp. SMMA_5]UXU80368.1 DUF2267 domain-containing protein [Paracoccus sp. SMMA_5_TC]